MKIVTDTSAMFSPAEGKEMGLTVLPLSVSVNGKTYTEFVDMFADEFLALVRAGGIPTSSQPAPGMTLEVFENATEELIVLSMADGLSGTYQSTVGVRNGIENNEHIHVINTKTLCGPHRYMVKKALKMQADGASTKEIIDEMNRLIASAKSFLIPSDFDFLKRGGRLTPLAATIGGMMKILPVMTQVEEGRRLEKFMIARTMKKAIDGIAKDLAGRGVGAGWLISVSHAGVKEQATGVLNQLHAVFPEAEIELLDLSPAFITQGGPSCIAIQAVIL